MVISAIRAYAVCQMKKLGFRVYYIIEKETNVGTTYYDTINTHKWWQENEYTRVFESRKEAEEFIEKNIDSFKYSCKRAGYRVKFISAKAVARVGKIVKDEKGEGSSP